MVAGFESLSLQSRGARMKIQFCLMPKLMFLAVTLQGHLFPLNARKKLHKNVTQKRVSRPLFFISTNQLYTQDIFPDIKLKSILLQVQVISLAGGISFGLHPSRATDQLVMRILSLFKVLFIPQVTVNVTLWLQRTKDRGFKGCYAPLVHISTLEQCEVLGNVEA